MISTRLACGIAICCLTFQYGFGFSYLKLSLRPHRLNVATKKHAQSRCLSSLMSAVANEDEPNMGATYEYTEQLNSFTDNKAYIGVQAIYAVAFAGLIDAGFSGDWVRYGFISDSTESVLRQAVYVTAAVHFISACGAAYVASTKNCNPAVSFGSGLLTGVLEILRTLGFLDEKEKLLLEKSKRSATELAMPPLQMEISSLTMGTRTSPSGVMLSTSIMVNSGAELEMRNLLQNLASETKEKQSDLVYTMAVNQDPSDRRCFFVLQRFPSVQAMSKHQNTALFKEYVNAAEPLIAEPMGLYLVNERSGRFTEPVYPFGPGGEGGRDDAVYSSPANLQGSQTRGMIDTALLKKQHAENN